MNNLQHPRLFIQMHLYPLAYVESLKKRFKSLVKRMDDRRKLYVKWNPTWPAVCLREFHWKYKNQKIIGRYGDLEGGVEREMLV